MTTASRTPLNDQEIFSRIDVTRPYYKLDNVQIDTATGTTYCAVQLEQLKFNEVPFASAETARHMAIAGSVAIAFKLFPLGCPKVIKHYYLAFEADYRAEEIAVSDEVKNVTIESTLLGIAPKKMKNGLTLNFAKVMNKLKNAANSKPVCQIEVTYIITPISKFPMKEFKEDEGEISLSPYVHPAALLEYSAARDSAKLAVLPHVCKGHFTNRPHMPVAILVSNAFHLLRMYLGKGFIIKGVIMKCNKVVPAGSIIDLKLTQTSKEKVQIDVYFESKSITSMDVTVQTIETSKL